MATRTERKELNTPPVEKAPAPAEVQELRIDPSIARTLVRRRLKTWLTLGFVGFAGIALYCLYGLQQSYTARTSLSIQKDDAGPSALSKLAGIGGGGGNKTYIGVLHSRNFAERVETQYNLKDLYGLKSFDEAVERIQKGVKAEESLTDGLTYINVTLPAPPRLASDPNGLRSKIKKATADIANAYALQLRRYLKDNDTDRESVVQRQAEAELKKAKRDYYASVDRMAGFVRNREIGKVLPYAETGTRNASTTPGASAAQSASAADEIRSLYIKRAELQQQIRSMDAEKAATKRVLQGSGNQMQNMPDEDPLLNQARADVNLAQTKVDRLLVSLAESHPDVVSAKQQLALARRRLQEKVNALLSGTGSDTIKLEALQASFTMVRQQIAEAEQKFQSGQERATDFEVLKNDVNLTLKVYETASQRYAEMALTTTSAQNRMMVIDDARPPLYAKPGMATMLAMSLFMPLLFIGAWFVIEYVLNTSRPPAYAATKVVDRAAGSNGH